MQYLTVVEEVDTSLVEVVVVESMLQRKLIKLKTSQQKLIYVILMKMVGFFAEISNLISVNHQSYLQFRKKTLPKKIHLK